MSFDDLLGEELDAPSPRLPGRPRGPNYEPSKPSTLNLRETSGVSIPWLSAMFRKNRRTITEALLQCKPIAQGKGGGMLYDLAEAATYLVVPRRDIKSFLKSLTAKDLPQELRETFWNAKLKEAKYRMVAGELWPTASVLEVFGETFKTIKTTTQLWTDTIDVSYPLSNDQRNLLIELVDKLLGELHQALIENAKSTATESFLAEIDDEDLEA